MVECEYGMGVSYYSGDKVLIDTWWNVNFFARYVYRFMGRCFNRYMVECECAIVGHLFGRSYSFNRYMVECESIPLYHASPGVAVLIDTWWNVNCYCRNEVLDREFVLIDTWWNVNFQKALVVELTDSFNRYMVECESGSLFEL